MVTTASASIAASSGEVAHCAPRAIKPSGLGLAAIPQRDREAGIEIAARHAVAHPSQSDEGHTLHG